MYKIYNYYGSLFLWQVKVPMFLTALLGLCWIIYLFPEWKKNLVMVIFLLLAIVVVLGGVFSVLSGISISQKVNWQRTSGVIISSFIEKGEQLKSTIDSRSSSGMITEHIFEPIIVCKYNIQGKEFLNKVNTGIQTTKSHEAQSILLNQYPVGKEISFYYNPKRPKNAVIEIPSTASRFLPGIIGLILLPGGLFIAWIIMVNLYNNGKSIDISELFQVPVRLEYKLNKAAVKIFKLPETETEKLKFYLRYLGSVRDYISKYNYRYTKFYTQERVLSEQIKTLERLIEIPQHDPWQLFNYGEDLYNILYRADRLSDARLVLEKIRDKYPDQFNASDLKNKLTLEK
jgi:hypothetical protein